MNKRASACLLLWLLATPGIARGDGKVFPSVTAKTTIPDQQALIHYADGQERLVVETRFIGTGNDFAWVVPLPAVPQVSQVTTGLFPTLRVLFQPRVIHFVPHLYIAVILLALFAGILLVARRRARILLVVLLGLLATFCLLPSLASTRGGAPTATTADVAVHERRVVGAYDVAVISSTQPDALLTWLQDNGFATTPTIAPVVADYVKQGWVFAAARLRRDTDTTVPTTPHPLAFTFKTQRPVYPLKLTGVENGPCTVDLFVFGPSRAQIPHFTVERCDQPEYQRSGGGPTLKTSRPPRIVHPQLRALVGRAPVATRLSARLEPAQMSDDAYISWTPFEPEQHALFSRHGARLLGVNIAIPLISIGWLISIVAARKNRISSKNAALACSAILLCAIGAGGATYATLPKTEVRIDSGSARYASLQVHHEIARHISDPAGSARHMRHLDEAQLSTLIKEAVGNRRLYERLTTNEFTGGPRRVEDSPGNCTLRTTERGLEYVWYDANGAEQVSPTGIIPPATAPTTTRPRFTVTTSAPAE